MAKRLYKFDNIKTILIFLVVLGHLLELTKGCELLYLTIYSFHMPLFMFVTGYFARFDRKHIIYHMVCPYLVFQVLYTYFDIYVLGSTKLTLTFVRPYWILWYLFAIIVYYLLIPSLDVESKKGKILIFLGSVVIALLSGYDGKLGYDFAAARICSFMPFFVAGFYLRREEALNRFIHMKKDVRYLVCFVCAVLIITGIVLILNQGFIKANMLYGSCSYELAHYNIWIKLLIDMIAFIWIAILLVLVPNKKVPLFSQIGRYTMPVFLFHGFVVKLVERYVEERGMDLTVHGALLISVILLLLLGNRHVNKLFSCKNKH